jgi:hypothetical protein
VNAIADLALIATEQESLTIDATSQVDTVLVVRTPDGQYHCDDDSGGNRNPRVTIIAAPGTTHVWVGPLSQPDSGSFELSYAARPLGNIQVDATGLAPSAEPTLRATPLTDEDLRRPARFEGSTDAEVDMNGMGTTCRGFVALAPSLRLELTRAHDVELRTVAQDDLTLATRGPDGQFRCDDDSGGGGQPRIRGELGPALTTCGWAAIARDPRFGFTCSFRGAEARRESGRGPGVDRAWPPPGPARMLSEP